MLDTTQADAGRHAVTGRMHGAWWSLAGALSLAVAVLLPHAVLAAPLVASAREPATLVVRSGAVDGFGQLARLGGRQLGQTALARCRGAGAQAMSPNAADLRAGVVLWDEPNRTGQKLTQSGASGLGNVQSDAVDASPPR